MKDAKKTRSGIVALLAVVTVVAVTATAGISTYNSLVKGEDAVQSSFAAIDIQLQGRNDLVPRLVVAIQDYAGTEQALLARLTEARTRMMGSGSIDEKIAADDDLSDAVRELLSMAEKYPELSANEDFLSLAAELSTTESLISVARKDYNDTVMSYNRRLGAFPARLLADALGFEKYYAFTAAPDSTPTAAVAIVG